MDLRSVFNGNVAVITGASVGIGREMALQLAPLGARLVLAARDERQLESLAAACRQLGGEAIAVPTDVSEEEQCRRLIEKTIEHFGRIDTLVNNAGISMNGRFEDYESLQPMEQIMRVNFFGSVYCTRYALPYLRLSQGRLVGVSSLTGKTGVPGRTFYAASKHAMAGFFDSLRIELAGSGVSVTMIYPGFVATEVRLRALNPGGLAAGESHINEEKAMSVETCVGLMLPTIARRRRELVMTARGRFGQWVKLLAPELVDRIARKAMEDGR